MHLSSLSPAYDDATLKAIQDSGGGVTTQLPELFERMAQKAALSSSVVSVADEYVWSIESLETPATESNLSDGIGFEPLAARQLVLGLSKKMDTKQLAQIDAIHAIAKTHKIVTPYSSMIVLVNNLAEGCTQTGRS
ncbi:MAG: hypothetical protein F6K36_26480 [Symploca sp. SIO3C6]|nr:hypothetical protein [Symploca sp. SIO3C6]